MVIYHQFFLENDWDKKKNFTLNSPYFLSWKMLKKVWYWSRVVQVSGFDGTGGFFIKIQNIRKFDDDLKKIFGKKKNFKNFWPIRKLEIKHHVMVIKVIFDFIRKRLFHWVHNWSRILDRSSISWKNWS